MLALFFATEQQQESRILGCTLNCTVVTILSNCCDVGFDELEEVLFPMIMTGAAKYDIGKHNSGISLELTTVFYCNFPKSPSSPESDNISDIEIGIQCIAGD